MRCHVASRVWSRASRRRWLGFAKTCPRLEGGRTGRREQRAAANAARGADVLSLEAAGVSMRMTSRGRSVGKRRWSAEGRKKAPLTGRLGPQFASPPPWRSAPLQVIVRQSPCSARTRAAGPIAPALSGAMFALSTSRRRSPGRRVDRPRVTPPALPTAGDILAGLLPRCQRHSNAMPSRRREPHRTVARADASGAQFAGVPAVGRGGGQRRPAREGTPAHA